MFFPTFNLEYMSHDLGLIFPLLTLLHGIMGADMASSRIMVVKTGRSTSEWHNFCIQTLIEVILASLERYLCVE
jgi:hypothetical protein